MKIRLFIKPCSVVPQRAALVRQALENRFVIGYTLSMSATELMKEIQSLPEQERERIFEFVLRSQQPDWATPKPPGYFAESHDQDEIEESDWFTRCGQKAIVP
jgi:hypothetical protein